MSGAKQPTTTADQIRFNLRIGITATAWARVNGIVRIATYRDNFRRNNSLVLLNTCVEFAESMLLSQHAGLALSCLYQSTEHIAHSK